MERCKFFRKKYPQFIYNDFQFRLIPKKGLEIAFDFLIPPDIRFRPKLLIKGVTNRQVEMVGQQEISNFAFNIGLIESLSYWKATCSPQFIVRAGNLNKEQIQWWKKLIEKGMGQFFYENGIDFKKPGFLEIKSSDAGRIKPKVFAGKLNKHTVFIPIGGGKDSAVALELLKQKGIERTCFFLNPQKAAFEIARIGGCRKAVIVERKIDHRLLELNKKGFLNGHTPFSAYLAFLSVFCAVLGNIRYIPFANEKSSNEGNVAYLGDIVNHQWSKSYEFEAMFRRYSRKYLAKNIEYFSLLRPLYEIQIARIFSRYPKYSKAFLSCNKKSQNSNLKSQISKWCGRCPKCFGTFILLYPFLDEIKTVKIFGQNLFSDKKLLPLTLSLIGENGFKPFECVGTKKENLIALYLSLKKYRGRVSVKLPILLGYFEKKVLPNHKRLAKNADYILNSWNPRNFLPKQYQKIICKSKN